MGTCPGGGVSNRLAESPPCSCQYSHLFSTTSPGSVDSDHVLLTLLSAFKIVLTTLGMNRMILNMLYTYAYQQHITYKLLVNLLKGIFILL